MITSIFNTVSFKTKGTIEEWNNVLERNKKDPFDYSYILKKVENLSLIEKIKYINTHWNTKRYTKDNINFKKQDKWLTPKEFNKWNGDCEDFAIAKFFTLKELGIENVKILIGIKESINTPHAVCIVDINNTTYILDNLFKDVLSEYDYKDFSPNYSLDENYKYIHVKARKSK